MNHMIEVSQSYDFFYLSIGNNILFVKKSHVILASSIKLKRSDVIWLLYYIRTQDF